MQFLYWPLRAHAIKCLLNFIHLGMNWLCTPFCNQQSKACLYCAFSIGSSPSCHVHGMANDTPHPFEVQLSYSSWKSAKCRLSKKYAEELRLDTGLVTMQVHKVDFTLGMFAVFHESDCSTVNSIKPQCICVHLT